MENLMEVMKAETSGLQIEKEPVVPNELIRKAIIQLNVMIEEKEAQIDLQLDPGDISIKAGSNSIYLVILNIISNAIKYSPTPKIIIQTSLQNDRYRISVKDNGIGIGRQYIGRLFKKFYRVPTGDIHNVKGLGLGLYFVKKVVDEHKGSIHVKSIVGTGTEFIIDLPIS
jgi:two-component system phosphate regulon sensor histidine kinase PhoR